jgi:hypothetical protein
VLHLVEGFGGVGFLSCCWSYLCKNLDSCHDLVHGMQFLKYTLILCWLLWVASCDVGDGLAWAWSSAPGACSAPPQVACPAPPWCLAPLLAFPAPPWCLAYFLLHLILFKWPCLLALVAGFGLVVIIPPWCSAHEHGELCECCWLWLLTVMCVICGVRYFDGCVAVLVVLLVD